MKKLVQIIFVVVSLIWLGGCSSSEKTYAVSGMAKGTVKGVVLNGKTLLKKAKADVGGGGAYDRSECEPDVFRPDTNMQKILSKTWSENGVEYTSSEENLTLQKEGSFAFEAKYKTGTEYNITIASMPDGVNCALKNNVGTVGSADIKSVELECTGSTPPPDEDNGDNVAPPADDNAAPNHPPEAAITYPKMNQEYYCDLEEGSDPIVFDGNTSSDPDGDPLTFEWSAKSGSVDISSIIADKNAPVSSVPLDGENGLCQLLNDNGCDSVSNTATCRVIVNLNVGDGHADDNESVTIYVDFPI